MVCFLQKTGKSEVNLCTCRLPLKILNPKIPNKKAASPIEAAFPFVVD